MSVPKKAGRQDVMIKERFKDFAINEKCAAGAGNFVEAMARAAGGINRGIR